jgi:hypothetical protein
LVEWAHHPPKRSFIAVPNRRTLWAQDDWVLTGGDETPSSPSEILIVEDEQHVQNSSVGTLSFLRSQLRFKFIFTHGEKQYAA